MAEYTVDAFGEANTSSSPSSSNVWDQHSSLKQHAMIPSQPVKKYPSSRHMYQHAAAGFPEGPVFENDDYESGNGAPRYFVAVAGTESNARIPLVNETNERIAAGYPARSGTFVVDRKVHHEDVSGRFFSANPAPTPVIGNSPAHYFPNIPASENVETAEIRSLRDQWESIGRNHFQQFRDYSAPPTYERGGGYFLKRPPDLSGVSNEAIPIKMVKREKRSRDRSVPQSMNFIERPTGDLPTQAPENDLELWKRNAVQASGLNCAQYNNATPIRTSSPLNFGRQDRKSVDAANLSGEDTTDKSTAQCDLVHDENQNIESTLRVAGRSKRCKKSKRSKKRKRKGGDSVVDMKTSPKSYDSQHGATHGMSDCDEYDYPKESTHSSSLRVIPKKESDNFEALKTSPIDEENVSSNGILMNESLVPAGTTPPKKFVMLCQIEVEHLDLDKLNLKVGDKSWNWDIPDSDAIMPELTPEVFLNGKVPCSEKVKKRLDAYNLKARKHNLALAKQPIAQVVGYRNHSSKDQAENLTSSVISNDDMVPLDLSNKGKRSKSCQVSRETYDQKPNVTRLELENSYGQTLESFHRTSYKNCDQKPDVTRLAFEKGYAQTLESFDRTSDKIYDQKPDISHPATDTSYTQSFESFAHTSHKTRDQKPDISRFPWEKDYAQTLESFDRTSDRTYDQKPDVSHFALEKSYLQSFTRMSDRTYDQKQDVSRLAFEKSYSQSLEPFTRMSDRTYDYKPDVSYHALDKSYSQSPESFTRMSDRTYDQKPDVSRLALENSYSQSLESFAHTSNKTYDQKPDISHLAFENSYSPTHPPKLYSKKRIRSRRRNKISHSIANIVPECVDESENLEDTPLEQSLIEEMIRPAKPVFHSYLENMPIEDNLIGNANAKDLFFYGIKMKLEADKERNQLFQIIKYMDALLLFLQAAVIIEFKVSQESTTTERTESVKTIFTESLNILDHIQANFCAYSAGTQPRIVQNIIQVFCKRTEAILLLKLYHMEKGDYKGVRMEVDNYCDNFDSENANAQSENAATYVHTPLRTLVAIKKLYSFNQTLRSPIDIWEQADMLAISENLSFFKQMDLKCGPLVIHSSLFHLITYITAGVTKIKIQLSFVPMPSTSIAAVTMAPIAPAVNDNF